MYNDLEKTLSLRFGEVCLSGKQTDFLEANRNCKFIYSYAPPNASHIYYHSYQHDNKIYVMKTGGNKNYLYLCTDRKKFFEALSINFNSSCMTEIGVDRAFAKANEFVKEIGKAIWE